MEILKIEIPIELFKPHKILVLSRTNKKEQTLISSKTPIWMFLIIVSIEALNKTFFNSISSNNWVKN